jgi:ribosomal protein S15P/S13E
LISKRRFVTCNGNETEVTVAKSNRERIKAYRERQKAKRKAATDSGSDDFRRSFSEWLSSNDANWSEFEIPLDIAGIQPPNFSDDRDPASATDAIDPESYEHVRKASIGRAEVMIECLLEAARALADHVNAYKRDELSARIEELDRADLSNPSTKKIALADIVRLTKARDRLEKQVRFTLPEWKVQSE